jgi:DNA-binding CsgD family transcriptional regulator
VRVRESVVSAGLLSVAALAGLGIGLVAQPSAAWWLLGAVLVLQVGVSLLAGWGERSPALWAVAILLVTVCTVAGGPSLIDLLRQGGVPWIPVALALGSQNLFLRARSPRERALGTVTLAAAVGTVVVFAVDHRAGIMQAVLAAATPLLAGALLASWRRLADARQDRLVQGSQAAASTPVPKRGVERALTLVALRSDALLEVARDDHTRAAVRDLRAIAIQGLTGGDPRSPGQAGAVIVTVRPEVAEEPRDLSPADRDPAGSDTIPDLSDKEREILRLVATGASNADIARRLYLSEATIKGYVSRLMRRFDHKNRTQLALMAARWFD